MKKLAGIIFAILFAVSPMVLRAEESKSKIDLSEYKTMNLKETLADEEIKEAFKSYSETDDQISIYLFRGKGCGYCRAFLTFLNSITDEYGKYFKVVSFESWYDENNSKLLSTISEFLGEPASGVPYIIIGDKVFGGYAESYDDGIKEAIKTLYDSEDRYDVFEAYNDSIETSLSTTAAVTIWNFVITGLGVLIVILYVKKSNEKLLNEISKIKPATTKKEASDEDKPVVKKAVKKNVKKK